MDKMLNGSFIFPELKYIKEVERIHSDKKVTTHQLFRLDWESFNDRMEKKFRNIIDQSIYSGTPYYNALPDEYEKILDTFVFLLDSQHLEQIRVSVAEANLIWSKNYPFDTVIREICLKPAISHFYVAFGLLADCIYDEKECSFSRDNSKKIATQLMLVKFWTHQTGRGLIKDHAYFDIISWVVDSYEEHVKNMSQFSDYPMIPKAYYLFVKDFLEKFEKHQEKCEDLLQDNVLYEQKNIIKEA